jgi:hypothetical protein
LKVIHELVWEKISTKPPIPSRCDHSATVVYNGEDVFMSVAYGANTGKLVNLELN